MKKEFILFFASCLLCTTSLYGQKVNVELVYDHTTTVKDGHPHAVPNVTSDGDDVNLTCDSLINNVDVVIRDQYGNVMHQSTQTIGPNETTLYVPSTDGDSEKTTIDLYYDRKHLSGYFDE